MEGNLRFKIEWTSLQLEGNLPFLLCFSLYLQAISKYKPSGAYVWRGDLTEGFLRYKFGRLISGRAYTWRGLFSEFYGISGGKQKKTIVNTNKTVEFVYSLKTKR